VTQPSTPASMEYRVAIWSYFDFLIPKMPKNTKICIWQPRWNMISPVIFAGALTIFTGAVGPCPCGPHPGDGRRDGAAFMYLIDLYVVAYNNYRNIKFSAKPPLLKREKVLSKLHIIRQTLKPVVNLQPISLQ